MYRYYYWTRNKNILHFNFNVKFFPFHTSSYCYDALNSTKILIEPHFLNVVLRIDQSSEDIIIISIVRCLLCTTTVITFLQELFNVTFQLSSTSHVLLSSSSSSMSTFNTNSESFNSRACNFSL